MTALCPPLANTCISSGGIQNGSVYASTNYGSTWKQTYYGRPKTYTSIACDSTGQYVTIVAYSGQIFMSPNFGYSLIDQDTIFKSSNDFGSIYFPYGNNNGNNNSNSLSGGAIAGIVIGVVALVCIIAGLIGYFYFGFCQKQSILKQANVEIEMESKAL